MRAAEGEKSLPIKMFSAPRDQHKDRQNKNTSQTLVREREKKRDRERKTPAPLARRSPESVEIQFRKTPEEEKFLPVMQHPHGSPQQLPQHEAATAKQANFSQRKSMGNSDHLSAPSLGKIDERQD